VGRARTGEINLRQHPTHLLLVSHEKQAERQLVCQQNFTDVYDMKLKVRQTDLEM